MYIQERKCFEKHGGLMWRVETPPLEIEPPHTVRSEQPKNDDVI